MNRIFVDADVILDLLAQRIQFYHFSAVLFTLSEMKEFELYTTPVVFANTFYVLRKKLGNEGAKKALRKLRLILKVIESDEKTIDSALNSDFPDFEDAVQYYTSLENGIFAIVTRNIKDYRNSAIPVMTPESFHASNGYL